MNASDMNDKPLDLAELARFCDELKIEDSYADPHEAHREASVHIGGYINGEYVGCGSKDYVPIDRAEKLVKLLESLPRLIELAGFWQGEHYPDWHDGK